MTRSGHRLGRCAAALAIVAAGCRGSSGPGAAEPADSPTGGPRPAGIVRAVGTRPEGIVVDTRTGIVAVAVRKPDRLLLLDSGTLAPRRAVRLPGHARHLVLAGAGGPVLVPVENADTLLQVPLTGPGRTATTVGRSPHSAAAVGNGRIVVGNEVGGTLSIVRAGRVERTVPGLRQPGGVVAAGPVVAVVDVAAFTVTTFDPATARRIATTRAGAGPTHVVLVAAHRMVVADTRGDALLVFDPQPLRLISRLPLAGTPYGVAADPLTQSVWVTLTARNQVVGVCLASGHPRVIARYPTVEQPNTVAVTPGSRTVYLAGARRGEVQAIRRPARALPERTCR
ncbi:MAG: YncE family protein [Mycobacteriales bacterium]|nr:MAG: hypothetical protein DLM56_09185 [Pseudonocardiales bacterium]